MQKRPLLIPRERRVMGVVVAAGRSARFGGALAKQFEELGGSTLVARSVHVLASRPAVAGVVVVLPPEEIDGGRAEEIRRLPGVDGVVGGGATRAASVRSGVLAVGDVPFVLVHDAARPLASPSLVDAVIEATLTHGAAAPAIPIRDTVKEDDGSGFVARTLDRSRLRLVQTPQGARTDWLLTALDKAQREVGEITDEASALERAGRKVRLVAGDPANRKITTPEDLAEARRNLTGDTGLRIGTGFDIHRSGASRPLVLGGIHFPGETGLLGHSDADVILHAVMDALLGAAALGDIGVHFPPGDPRFAGAASTDLAREVARIVGEAGYGVVNVDMTLLADRPRIRDRVAEMREVVAGCLGLVPGQVSVKATTLEGLGSLGRGEGVACQAVALLSRRGASR